MPLPASVRGKPGGQPQVSEELRRAFLIQSEEQGLADETTWETYMKPFKGHFSLVLEQGKTEESVTSSFSW